MDDAAGAFCRGDSCTAMTLRHAVTTFSQKRELRPLLCPEAPLFAEVIS